MHPQNKDVFHVYLSVLPFSTVFAVSLCKPEGVYFLIPCFWDKLCLALFVMLASYQMWTFSLILSFPKQRFLGIPAGIGKMRLKVQETQRLSVRIEVCPNNVKQNCSNMPQTQPTVIHKQVQLTSTRTIAKIQVYEGSLCYCQWDFFGVVSCYTMRANW